MKTTVIHHSADMDGIFCREIARKFLPDAKLIGWDFADKPLPVPEGQIYVLDLPVDRAFGFDYSKPETVPLQFVAHGDCRLEQVVWIDHHKSSIESHPANIPGYRIDGVAACRLAWQWFASLTDEEIANSDPHFLGTFNKVLPEKQDFIDRKVIEPLAVRLAGEYDIWDKRDPNAEVFQFGLQSRELTPEEWSALLSPGQSLVSTLLNDGFMLQRYQQRNDAGMMHRSFIMEFEGLKFLTLTTARCNSLTFASKDVPETGHDALMGLYYDGEKWNVSMYHAKHRMGLDLSKIAVKFGGGGHKGACGFQSKTFPS